MRGTNVQNAGVTNVVNTMRVRRGSGGGQEGVRRGRWEGGARYEVQTTQTGAVLKSVRGLKSIFQGLEPITGAYRAYSRGWNQSQGPREHIPGVGTNHRGLESIFQGSGPSETTCASPRKFQARLVWNSRMTRR
eukprot:1184891-Prorocentrum_minimum.AAC.1